MEVQRLKTDVLIIGGGTAGCYASLTIAERNPDTKVIICGQVLIYNKSPL